MRRADARSTVVEVADLRVLGADGRAVVDGVSFDVEPGEVVGLVGRGGSGGRELLHALLGLRPVAGGSALVLGRRWSALLDPLRRVGVYLGPAADPSRRVRDELRLAAARAGTGHDRIDTLLADAGLESLGRRRVRDVTLGERRRLALVATLVGDPELVVLDEPSTGLDPEGMAWLRGLLRDLARDGRSVLVATHPLAAVVGDLDRVLALADGRLVADATPEQLVEAQGEEVVVSTSAPDAVARRLEEAGIDARVDGDDVRTRAATRAETTELAVASGVQVWGATAQRPSSGEAVVAVLDGEADAPSGRDGDPRRDGHPPADEEAADRLLADAGAAAPGGGQVLVAVVGPLPGLGASTTAAALGEVLAQAGRRPLVVALAPDDGALVRAAPAAARSSLTLDDLLRDLPGFDEDASLAPYLSTTEAGASLLGGPAERRERPLELDALLDRTREDHDVVVADVGAQVDPGTLRAVVARADSVVLVATAAAGEELMGAAALDVIEQERSEPALLVLNRVDPAAAAAGADGGDAGPGDELLLPHDPGLAIALRQGEAALEQASEVTRTVLKRLAAASLERAR